MGKRNRHSARPDVVKKPVYSTEIEKYLEQGYEIIEFKGDRYLFLTKQDDDVIALRTIFNENTVSQIANLFIERQAVIKTKFELT